MKTVMPFLAASVLVLTQISIAQWKQTSLDTRIISTFVAKDSNLFAGSDSGVFVSTNSGTTWTAVNSGLTNLNVVSLVAKDSDLFAGTYGGGVFLSTNNGTSWSEVNTGLTMSMVTTLAANAKDLFVGLTSEGGGGHIFLSTNSGANWNEINSGLVGYARISNLKISGTNLIAGTCGNVEGERCGVFVSTNYGTSWNATGLANTGVYFLQMSGQNIFAGAGGGNVFVSANKGADWTAANIGVTNSEVRALAVSGGSLFAGAYGGVFVSTDNGTSWIAVNAGLTEPFVFALMVSGTNLFVGTASGVWRRELSDMVTGLAGQYNEMPTQFSLQQNYPNPFNPSTTIEYQTPKQSVVTLKIFDLLGREVAVLVNEIKQGDTHNAKWDASRLSSGVYFYTITAGSFRETKRMVLIK